MIVSFAHNYIYFRPKKTGSTTIAEVLTQSLKEGDYFGPKDIPEHIELDRRPLHLKASDVRKAVPPDFWERAFKFASERHPYEKAVSMAYFRLGKQQTRRSKSDANSLKRFAGALERVVAKGEYRGFDYYSIDGEPVVTDFIRHETLEADLRRIAGRLNIPVPAQLPLNKSSFRLDRRPAREILSEEQKRAVFENCRREFALLGYDP